MKARKEKNSSNLSKSTIILEAEHLHGSLFFGS